MKLELVPLLQIEGDLHDIPRGRERFERYLRVMTGGTDDMLLPLAFMNPMGKEHVAAALDSLLAIDAEAVAAQAIVEAARRLARVSGSLKVGLVIVDDLGGGWTDRYLTEVKQRFENEGEPRRGWAVALLWSSERATPDRVRAEVLAAIYRTRYLQQHALPKTLGQMMQQEGLAAVFADLAQPVFSSADLAALRTAIDPYRGSAHFPTAFACLYGDDAARVVGYPPLGLPTLAGFALAADEIRRRKLSPEAALLNAAPPVR